MIGIYLVNCKNPILLRNT
ncbi:hypothetical protein ACFVP8_14255 [Viridibacillus arvi]